jgi:thermostable 8-oxoguanine DNA glycosylase
LRNFGVLQNIIHKKIVSTHTLEGLRKTSALDFVSTTSIHRFYLHCMRILDAYAAGIGNGTAEFRERAYKA